MLMAITDGRIDQAEARKLGFFTSGGEEYKALPPTLYHVTTAYDRVQEEGLRTREEHGRNIGIGGGSSNTISLTTDAKLAEGYFSSVTDAHEFMAGKRSVEDLLSHAKAGEGAGGEWYSNLVETYQRESRDSIDGMPIRLYDAIHGTETWAVDESLRGHPELRKIMAFWGANAADTVPVRDGTFMQRTVNAEQRLNQKAELLNRWLFWREQAGGPHNPAFFTNNWEQFAAQPSATIRLLEVAPRPGAQGYYLPGESEFRVHSGTVLPVRRVLKEWNEEDHPRGETVEGTNKGSFAPRNVGFVSPNIDENVDFTEAAGRVQSQRTKLLLQANDDIDALYGTGTNETVGVGAWKDGAEQSVIVDGEGDFEAFKAHLCLSGLLADQKSVLAFTNDDKGPDSLYRLSVGNRPLKEVHGTLLAAGVEFHTLRKTDHNVDVFVFGQGSPKELEDALNQAAEEFGVDDIPTVRGYGEFIGSWDSREEGRKAYETVLDAYEESHPVRDGGWKTVRDRWWDRIRAVAKAAGWLSHVIDAGRGQTPVSICP
jgi:hypothetical protein